MVGVPAISSAKAAKINLLVLGWETLSTVAFIFLFFLLTGGAPYAIRGQAITANAEDHSTQTMSFDTEIILY